MAPDVVCVPGPPVHRLGIQEVFDRLSNEQKLYAHHLSRAAWQGSRIIMRQVSPEANGIFDFIMILHKACGGNWQKLVEHKRATAEELAEFLEYAAHFLSNMGNYWGDGDQKFVPNLSNFQLRVLSVYSDPANDAFERVCGRMLSDSPSKMGYPSESAQSAYYPEKQPISKEEIASISRILGTHDVGPENTRVQKTTTADGETLFEVLQASAIRQEKIELEGDEMPPRVDLIRTDHADELTEVCASLNKAKKCAEKCAGYEKQVEALTHYIRALGYGYMETLRDAHKAWVQDTAPVVESFFGFVGPLRDPHGVRREWEGIVGISDPDESLKVRELMDRAPTFIRLLPWAVPDVNDGKGPFEKDVFVAPDYASIYALAFCRSSTFEAANLPNDNDIRETCGSKNIMIANRMDAKNDPSGPLHYVHESDLENYRRCARAIRFVTTAVHELLGRGSGKLLSKADVDQEHPPISPVTGSAITTYYDAGQTWTSVFGDIAASVEECRAMLVPLYLIDNKELLSTFGYNEKSGVTAEDLMYNTYIQIGVEGLQSLEYYDVENKTWKDAHKRAHWAILNHLLRDGGGVLSVEHDAKAGTLTVKVDKSKLLSHGKPHLEWFLCRLHVWRCTADVDPCREYYEDVTSVTGRHQDWKLLVDGKPKPRWKFVHANTFLEGEQENAHVTVKEYEATNEGIIQSWAERSI